MKKKKKNNLGLFLKNELPLIAWRNRCVEYVLHAALWWQGLEMCYRKGLVEPPEGNDPAGAPAWKKVKGSTLTVKTTTENITAARKLFTTSAKETEEGSLPRDRVLGGQYDEDNSMRFKI